MATLKLVLHENKTRKNGLAPVYLRITAQRRTNIYNSGVNVDPAHWNADREQVRRSHPQAQFLNQSLDDIMRRAIEANLALRG